MTSVYFELEPAVYFIETVSMGPLNVVMFKIDQVLESWLINNTPSLNRTNMQFILFPLPYDPTLISSGYGLAVRITKTDCEQIAEEAALFKMRYGRSAD